MDKIAFISSFILATSIVNLVIDAMILSYIKVYLVDREENKE